MKWLIKKFYIVNLLCKILNIRNERYCQEVKHLSIKMQVKFLKL